MSIAGDKRPYLLDAKSADLVLAIPEGDHEFEFRRNYWLVLSKIAKRAWVIARDAKDIVHLYEWEDRSKPPELPNNPFPFVPDAWDPEYPADQEEVILHQPLADCTRAVLVPPNDYECLDTTGLEQTVPLSDGWRIDHDETTVFNRRDGTGYDLSALCGGDQVGMTILDRRRPRVQIYCILDPTAYMVWMPPDRVQRLDRESAVKVNERSLSLYYHDDIQRFELAEHWPQAVDTDFNSENLVRELIGNNYDCPDLSYSPGNSERYGVKCQQGIRVEWLELVDTRQKLRARFSGSEIAVSRNGRAVAIVRGGQQHRVVRAEIGAKR